MRLYRLLVEANYQNKEEFPFKSQNSLGLDLDLVRKLQINTEDQEESSYTYYYNGTLEDEVVILTPGVYLCTSSIANELSAYPEIELIHTSLIHLATKKKNQSYLLFRPKYIIPGLINEQFSTHSVYGQGQPYEFKSYNKITLDKKRVDQLSYNFFRIPENPLSMYMKENVKDIFDTLPMFEVVESQVR